jgi:lipopolysaccharide transport system permease protein
MIFESLWRSRQLIWALTLREVLGRYRGSIAGIFWSFLSPLLMLVVYTFVFSVIFQSRWGQHPTNHSEFAVMLFAGLIVFTIFADSLNRSSGLILNNTNYVKRIVFPLDSLAWAVLGSAVFHGFASVLVLLAMHAIFHATIHWTIILFPLVLVPIVLVTIGITWFLASLGVFLRDVAQMVGIFTSAMMFLSPIFYPPTALPAPLRSYALMSPLAFTIEQTRNVLIRGELPNWLGLLVHLGIGILVAWLGLVWFEKTRHAFADVV